LIAVPDAGGLIRTWPGSLFTYQFLHAFVDTRALSRCEQVNWYANSALAIRRTIAHAESNPQGFATYGANAWGLSAAEGPYDAYHAYAAPPVAVANPPEEDGTVTYYSMISSLTFGSDLRQQAIAAANAGWARGHWHPRFGLPDAFNDEVAQSTLDPAAKDAALRKNGPWVQRALFAIDQGPMLLHLENARSGLIWQLTARNPNLAGTLRRSCPVAYLPLIIATGGTASATATPGPTATATQTPTNTPISMPTASPTLTATPSITPSPTSTRAATNTPTPTHTPVPPAEITREAEWGTGDGVIMQRSNASQLATRWLHVGEAVTLTTTLPASAAYSITVRYSNDSYTAPLEEVDVYVDGGAIGSFMAEDTGDWGYGWNIFLWSTVIGSQPVQLSAGSHTITLRVRSGDSYGIEIDCVLL
jgi:hypothetical protein